MKKINFICVGMLLFLAGCSLDDENNYNFRYDLVAIDSVTIPDTLVYLKNYEFQINYSQPNTCYFFEGFDKTENKNTVTIAVINSVILDENCDSLTHKKISKKMLFSAARNDFYLFKFWQGENENGEATYLEKKVPVVSE